MAPTSCVEDKDAVRADFVAAELVRRGKNSHDTYLMKQAYFMAGRLPANDVTEEEVIAVAEDALLMSRFMADEVIGMAQAAFGEARFYG